MKNLPKTLQKYYKPYGFVTDEYPLLIAASDLVVTRAGGSLSELAFMAKPAILIPIPEAVRHDQRANAYAYAHTGAAVVLEEGNLTPHVLASEARRIATTPDINHRMSASAAGFAA